MARIEYNAYCNYCNRDTVVYSEDGVCPHCKKRVKILGKKVKLAVGNGQYGLNI